MEFEFLLDGTPRKITVEKRDDLFVFREGERFLEADILPVSENELTVRTEGRSLKVYMARDKDRSVLHIGGRQYDVREPPRDGAVFLRSDDKSPEGSLRVKAPMPGKVIKVCIAEGDEVRKNQTLIIVEAMKMENEIKSSIEGIVKKIHAAAGELVDSERALIEVEPKK
jgi:biotin carboxyl carrier protein